MLVAAVGLLGLGTWNTAPVHAQGRWTLTPSLSVAERFDDNIFLTSDNRESDFITEFTPSVLLRYELPPLSLSAGYSITGEVYADHSDLNNFGDNQTGFLSASYQASQSLTLGLAGYYARTNDPETFLRPPSVPSGTTVTTLPTIIEGRGVVSQLTLTASATYQFDAATAGTGAYSFASTTDGDDISHTVTLGLTRQLTALDQGTITGIASFFDTSGSEGNSEGTDTSFGVLLGWIRQWTPSLSTTAALGPQVTEGDWNVAAILGLRYQLQRDLSVALTYTQGTSVVVGASGPQLASTLLGSVNYQVTQLMGVTAFGSIGRTAPVGDFGSSDATTNYAAGLTASYQVKKWMALYLQYQFTFQDDVGSGNIQDNQVTVGLTFSHPFFY